VINLLDDPAGRLQQAGRSAFLDRYAGFLQRDFCVKTIEPPCAGGIGSRSTSGHSLAILILVQWRTPRSRRSSADVDPECALRHLPLNGGSLRSAGFPPPYAHRRTAFREPDICPSPIRR
jgi:hypothetical protein